MRFLSKLFEKGEDPSPVVDDPQLGRMEWSPDDEAWVGTSGVFRFALAYERKATPTLPLLCYAKEVLSDPGWLGGTLEEEKRRWASKIPPSTRSELAALKFGLIYFSIHKDRGPYIFAIVDGGGEDRSWRIEYHGRQCDGLGFDT
jgi:hypothetical protein